jgi:hypothetical protein
MYRSRREWYQRLVMTCTLIYIIMPCYAVQLAIDDRATAYPYITLLTPPTPMDWDRGFGALGIATSHAVRINAKVRTSC